MSQYPQADKRTCQDVFQGIGALVGFPYAFHAALNLKTENITSIPYAGEILATYLPLELYKTIIPVLLIGTFANYYSNFGIAMDVLIKNIKILLQYSTNNNSLSLSIITNIKIKNVGHLLGALFGMLIAVYFIYCNFKDPMASFSLPYGAAKGVPNVFLQIGAVLYISGACSNLFSHFAEGTKNSFAVYKHFIFYPIQLYRNAKVINIEYEKEMDN